MAEYIEREALIARWKAAMLHMVKSKDGQHPVSIETLIEDLKLFPAADVAPVVHGRWERIGEQYENCTNCGTIFEALPTQYGFELNNKFCRNCGAKMDVPDINVGDKGGESHETKERGTEVS